MTKRWLHFANCLSLIGPHNSGHLCRPTPNITVIQVFSARAFIHSQGEGTFLNYSRVSVGGRHVDSTILGSLSKLKMGEYSCLSWGQLRLINSERDNALSVWSEREINFSAGWLVRVRIMYGLLYFRDLSEHSSLFILISSQVVLILYL